MSEHFMDLSPADPVVTRDPFTPYAAMRETAPLVRVVMNGLPGWMATGHGTVRELLSDPRLSSGRHHALPEVRQLAPWVFATEATGLSRSLLLSDPPDHTRLRRMVSRAFTPRRIEALRPRTEEICAELLAAFLPRGEADLIDEFAVELPMLVIAELLGVPVEDRHDFRHWSVTAASEPSDPAEALAAYRSIRDYIDDLIPRKRAHNARHGAGADLLSALIALQDDGDQLDDAELRSTAANLLIAGHETTTNLIGTGILALLQRPERLAELLADPALIEPAIEEFLRFDAPVGVVNIRFALEELKVGGIMVRPGEAVLLSAGASGRDPEVFDAPDELDFHRENVKQHMGFGHGIHYCLGAPLARMEASVAFRALLGQCHGLALAVPEDGLQWRRSVQLHGLRHLPVTFTPTG
ncbi:cytochrome P450 [Streptomyces sp. NPDC056632]|uniref:cytochrome P450 family protein n=1 Tax=Streptomyces sp. NPDC056632 TaxID=3345884 RepID=UPI003693D859